MTEDEARRHATMIRDQLGEAGLPIHEGSEEAGSVSVGSNGVGEIIVSFERGKNTTAATLHGRAEKVWKRMGYAVREITPTDDFGGMVQLIPA